MNPVLGLVILIIAFLVIEIDDFRLVSFLLGLLGTIITITSILDGKLIEIVPLAIFSIIFIPGILYYFSMKTKRTEEPPLIPGLPSSGLLVILVIIAFTISVYFLGITGIQWPLIVIGSYGLLSKTDLRKSVSSLSILTYSIHLLIPAIDVVIDGVIILFSATLFVVLLYFAHRIFLLKGSLSTKDLKELQF
jgi:hypothetical protein